MSNFNTKNAKFYFPTCKNSQKLLQYKKPLKKK